MSLSPLHISDDLKQAFWRIALNRNPHWARYYTSKDKPRGANDNQASVGRLTHGGHDARDQAGKAYWYTPPVVDEHQFGFGFWSRSDQGDDSTYRFVAYDIEPIRPIGRKRVNTNPSQTDGQAALTDAVQVYVTWKRLAESIPEILWVLLVESSEHHYHVWVLFERPLTQAEHDEFLARAFDHHGSLKNLDKTTDRARRGVGDQFRAPWSWKKYRRSEALQSWLRSESLAIELGQSATVRKVPQTKVMAKCDNPLDLQQYAIECFPIEGPGQRNYQQARLVGSLLGRELDTRVVLKIGLAWLKHFRNEYSTPWEEAKAQLADCIQRTLSNPKFQPAKARIDYRQLHRQVPLLSWQVQFLGSTITQLLRNNQRCDPLPTCDPLHVHVEDHIPVEDHTCKISPGQGKTGNFSSRNGNGTLCQSDQEYQFVEALILHCEQKVKETDSSTIKMTNQQIMEIIESRHQEALGPEQFNRLKKRFASFSIGRSGQRWHQATRFELLKEVSKGHPGVPSRYQITGLLGALNTGAGEASKTKDSTPTRSMAS